MKTSTNTIEQNRQAVAIELSKLLADEFLLSTKTRNAHWNVEGPDFHAMHLFFESQYDQLDEIIDKVAERIRAIGHYAPATLKSYLSLTHLSENTERRNDSKAFIQELVSDHESVINFLHKNVKVFADEHNDPGTSDFITGLLEDHEKLTWMLKSHLK